MRLATLASGERRTNETGGRRLRKARKWNKGPMSSREGLRRSWKPHCQGETHIADSYIADSYTPTPRRPLMKCGRAYGRVRTSSMCRRPPDGQASVQCVSVCFCGRLSALDRLCTTHASAGHMPVARIGAVRHRASHPPAKSKKGSMTIRPSVVRLSPGQSESVRVCVCACETAAPTFKRALAAPTQCRGTWGEREREQVPDPCTLGNPCRRSATPRRRIRVCTPPKASVLSHTPHPCLWWGLRSHALSSAPVLATMFRHISKCLASSPALGDPPAGRSFIQSLLG